MCVESVLPFHPLWATCVLLSWGTSVSLFSSSSSLNIASEKRVINTYKERSRQITEVRTELISVKGAFERHTSFIKSLLEFIKEKGK